MLWYLISLVAFKTIDWFIFRILVDGYNGKKKISVHPKKLNTFKSNKVCNISRKHNNLNK